MYALQRLQKVYSIAKYIVLCIEDTLFSQHIIEHDTLSHVVMNFCN